MRREGGNVRRMGICEKGGWEMEEVLLLELHVHVCFLLFFKEIAAGDDSFDDSCK